jgi:hypothetical protein
MRASEENNTRSVRGRPEEVKVAKTEAEKMKKDGEILQKEHEICLNIKSRM